MYSCRGVQGTQIWNAIRYTFGFTGLKYNYFSEIMDRWTPDNVNATVPRATWMDPNNNKKAFGLLSGKRFIPKNEKYFIRIYYSQSVDSQDWFGKDTFLCFSTESIYHYFLFGL